MTYTLLAIENWIWFGFGVLSVGAAYLIWRIVHATCAER